MSIGITILKYAICYFGFFAALLISKANGGYKLFDEKGPAQNTSALLGLHITEIICLGIIPAVIFNHPIVKIVFGTNTPGLIQVLILILLLYPVILFARDHSEKAYKKIDTTKQSSKLYTKEFIPWYFLVRFFFLCAYEIFLRGYLLMDSIYSFGIFKAVLLNITLYALLHVPAGKNEMIASVPFGVLLCLICIWFNAAWPAIILHLILSFSYELNLLKRFYKPINVLS